MKKAIVLELDEAVIAKVELLMAFDNIATMEQWIAEMVEADWVAMNELKVANPPHINEMDDYISHEHGFAGWDGLLNKEEK